jgi:hypothetical protein
MFVSLLCTGINVMALPLKTLEDVYKIFDSIVPDEYGCHNYPRGNGLVGHYVWVTVKGIGRIKVHRLALERKLGRQIQPGMLALHTCDWKSCVNEDHLYEGTNRDNQLDRLRNPDDWNNSTEGREHLRKVQQLGLSSPKMKVWRESPELREHLKKIGPIGRQRQAENPELIRKFQEAGTRARRKTDRY